MAHFAQLDENNNVINVIVVKNSEIEVDGVENENAGILFCKSLLGNDTVWKQTSYNATFRYNFAQIGATYDADNDAFIDVQPYPSWALDENYKWQPPVEYPTDGLYYTWNEETTSWDLVE